MNSQDILFKKVDTAARANFKTIGDLRKSMETTKQFLEAVHLLLYIQGLCCRHMIAGLVHYTSVLEAQKRQGISLDHEDVPSKEKDTTLIPEGSDALRMSLTGSVLSAQSINRHSFQMMPAAVKSLKF